VALIDVIKWDAPAHQVVWKYPRTDLTTASQLIVNEGQAALLFKNGQCFDVFGAGRHTLSTQNIPILNKLVNLPFGGRSPFAAEVWFVNRALSLDMKFGTPTPLQLEDPQYQVIVPVRAFGQFGLEITDPGALVRGLVGSNLGMTQPELISHFKGMLVSRLKSRIAQVIVHNKIGVLEIETQLHDLSTELERAYTPDYADFGLRIRAFRLMSISVPQDDPSVMALKKAKSEAARRRIEGTNYAQERQLDILQTSAANEGAGGAFASIGTGFGMGQAIGHMAQQQYAQQAPPPPPAPSPFGTPPPEFHIHLNDQQVGPYGIDVLKQGVASGQFTRDTPVWRAGMPQWTPAGQVAELAVLFGPPPGPDGPPPFGGSGGPPPFSGG